MGDGWGSRSSLNRSESTHKGDTGGTENNSLCQTEGSVGGAGGEPWEVPAERGVAENLDKEVNRGQVAKGFVGQVREFRFLGKGNGGPLKATRGEDLSFKVSLWLKWFRVLEPHVLNWSYEQIG